MFHMASPWDAWGMQSGNYGHPWASGAGSRRKRVADPFTFGRSWMGDESDDSDSDVYQNDYYRSAAPRRAARPEPDWFCDPMAARRSRAAAPDPTENQRRAAAAPQARQPQQSQAHTPLQRSQHQQQQQQQQQQRARQQPAFSGKASPQFASAAPERRHQPAQGSAAARQPVTPAAPAAQAAATGPTRVPVRTFDAQASARPKAGPAMAPTAPAAPPKSNSRNPSSGGPKASQAPRPTMSPSQAACTIQRWWRGWRLWRHAPALRQLVALSRDLRTATGRFQEHLDATGGNLTDMQQLEVNELAMRAILKLDGLEGLPQELRLLRKGLTAKALRLQDDVFNTYARSSERPAHLRVSGAAAVTAAAPAVSPAPVSKANLEPVTEPPKGNASPTPSPAMTPRRQSPASSASPSTATTPRQSPAPSARQSPVASPAPSASPSPVASRQPSPHRQSSPVSSRTPSTQPASPVTSQPATPRRPQSSPVPSSPEATCAPPQHPPALSPISSPSLSPSSSASLSDSYQSCVATPVVRGPMGHFGHGPKAWALSDRSISGTFSGASEDGDEVFDDALEGDCRVDVNADDSNVASAGAKPGRKTAAAAEAEDEEMPEAPQCTAPWWSAGRLWRRMRKTRSRRNRH